MAKDNLLPQAEATAKKHQPSSRSFAANNFPSKDTQQTRQQVKSSGSVFGPDHAQLPTWNNLMCDTSPSLDRRPMNSDFTWRKSPASPVEK
jgi:hypothetical protein